MALQLAESTRNARLDAIETEIGTAPVLKLRTGSPPADCAAGDSGTVVSTITLPSDWMNDAASGSKTKKGTWQDTSADSTGTVGHFRIYDSGGSVCHVQGTCTNTGGLGDMELDNVDVNAGQQVTITGFTLTDGNA